MALLALRHMATEWEVWGWKRATHTGCGVSVFNTARPPHTARNWNDDPFKSLTSERNLIPAGSCCSWRRTVRSSAQRYRIYILNFLAIGRALWSAVSFPATRNARVLQFTRLRESNKEFPRISVPFLYLNIATFQINQTKLKCHSCYNISECVCHFHTYVNVTMHKHKPRHLCRGSII